MHSNRQERCIVKLSFDKKPSRLTEAPETAHCCSLMLFATCKLDFSNFDINAHFCDSLITNQQRLVNVSWVYIYTEKSPSKTHDIISSAVSTVHVYQCQNWRTLCRVELSQIPVPALVDSAGGRRRRCNHVTPHPTPFQFAEQDSTAARPGPLPGSFSCSSEM